MNQVLDRSLRVFVGRCKRRQFDPCCLDRSLGCKSEMLLQELIRQIRYLRLEAAWVVTSESDQHSYSLDFHAASVCGCSITIKGSTKRTAHNVFRWTYNLEITRSTDPGVSMRIWAEFEGFQKSSSEAPVDEAFVRGCVQNDTAWMLRDLWREFAYAGS